MIILGGLGIDSRKLRTTELGRNNIEGIWRGNDVVAMNYHKFDCESSERYVDAVLNMAKKTDLIIFDESQNNKGFGKRGRNIKRFIDKTRNKRVLVLSATPGHNGLEDLGITLHILDERFPFAKYDYNADPTAIKDLRLSGQWFTSDRDDVRALYDLPKLLFPISYNLLLLGNSPLFFSSINSFNSSSVFSHLSQ